MGKHSKYSCNYVYSTHRPPQKPISSFSEQVSLFNVAILQHVLMQILATGGLTLHLTKAKLNETFYAKFDLS